MWKFFQSLFSKSTPSATGTSLGEWGIQNGFKHEAPAKVQLRNEYDHLAFFKQGSDHKTAQFIRKRTPDSATVIAECTAAHDGTTQQYICYLFENTTESLPTLHFANRENPLFANLRGSKLSPISMPSEFSATHSGLSKVPQWGDRVLKNEEIKSALSQINPDQLIWIECDDCHILIVTTEFNPALADLGKHIFHHFAQYRFRK